MSLTDLVWLSRIGMWAALSSLALGLALVALFDGRVAFLIFVADGLLAQVCVRRLIATWREG